MTAYRSSLRAFPRALISAVERARIAYVDTREVPQQRLPEVLQFPVNDICNSRCEMCFIWERKKGRELQPEEVRTILRDPLFRQVRAVGLNGGEPTLRSDLADVAAATIESLPSLGYLNVITNALQPRLVLPRLREVAAVTAARNVHFDVMVSLDGVGDVHDAVRGRPGNFATAEEVITGILEEGFAQSLRIGCTLTPTNAAHGEELLEWAQARGIYARFRVAVEHNRLYNRDRPEPFVIHDDEMFPVLMLLDRLSREYEDGTRRGRFYRSLLDQLAYGHERRAGCAWRNHGVSLLADGQLAYCAVESPDLGDTTRFPPLRLYEENDDVRREILRSRCERCTHDYEGPADFEEEMREIISTVPVARRVQRDATRLADRVRTPAKFIRELVGWRLHGSGGRGSGGRTARRLLLTGWYGTETIGDQAILGGIVPIALDWFDEVQVASLEPFITERTLRLLGLGDRVSVVPYARTFEGVEAGDYGAVAMAGGPVMGTIPQIRLLSRLHRRAAAHGLRTGLLGVGIGPTGKGLSRRLVGAIVRGSDVVLTRDRASARTAVALGATGATWAADPAFVWLSERVDGPAATGGIGLALRRWPIYEYGDGTVDATARARFETTLRREIDTLDAPVRPIPMGFVHVGGDDRRALRELLGPMDELTALRAFPTPEGVLARLASSETVVAMRFHAALFAAAAGRPTVVIDYTMGGKLAAFAADGDLEALDPRVLREGDLTTAIERARTVDPVTVESWTERTRDGLRDSIASLAGTRV